MINNNASCTLHVSVYQKQWLGSSLRALNVSIWNKSILQSKKVTSVWGKKEQEKNERIKSWFEMLSGYVFTKRVIVC